MNLSVICCLEKGEGKTDNLELNRHDSKIQHLYSRPNNVVGLERRYVDVLKLSEHCSPSSTLCKCHECEEESKTCS